MVFEFEEYGWGIEVEDSSEVMDFDGCESFDGDFGVELSDRVDEVDIIREWSGGVESADDMDFLDIGFLEGKELILDLLDGHEVAIGVGQFFFKGAERAFERADVGIIDMGIEDVEDFGLMFLGFDEGGEV